MEKYSITASDEVRIVYDVVGEGPAIILLHGGGGGQTRLSWHQTGYVERLKTEFKVITIDIRGHGESDQPIDPAFYSIDTICEDILLVADACGVDDFMIWGFSYGGNIGRYLAAKSNRVTKIIIMGIPFGPAASGNFRQSILDFRAHWAPIVQAKLDGSLDMHSLSEDEQRVMQQMNAPVMLAWLSAMLDWGENEPGDLRCPALWLAGTENEGTITSIKAYENILPETNVQTHIVEGFTHIQEFEEIDRVFPAMLAFSKA